MRVECRLLSNALSNQTMPETCSSITPPAPSPLSQMHIKLDLRVGISCLAFGLLALLYSILDAPRISGIIQLVRPCSFRCCMQFAGGFHEM